ncbi:hypothetical protein Tco_0916710 [Tanacetum coccineum]
MACISTTFTSRYLPTNNHVRTSSNPGIRQLFKTVELRCRRFRGDKLRGMQAVVQERKATWQDSVPNQKALGIQHGLKRRSSVVLMAKIYAYDSEVLSEVPSHDTYLENHVIDQSVKEMQYYEQQPFNNETDFDITSNSNVISYEQYLKETKNAVVKYTNSSDQQDAMIMCVIEEMSNQVSKCNEESKAKEDNYLDEIIDLEKKKKAKASSLQNDPIVKDNKVNIAPIDYAALNKLSEHFIEKKELFIENDRLLEHINCQDVMCIVMHADVEFKCVLPENDNRLGYAELEQSYINEYSKVLELEAEISKKNDLVEKVVYTELSKRCARMETRYLERLSPKLLQNRESHVDYLKHTHEHADTLQIVKHATTLKPLDSDLDSACKFAT